MCSYPLKDYSNTFSFFLNSKGSTFILIYEALKGYYFSFLIDFKLIYVAFLTGKHRTIDVRRLNPPEYNLWSFG
jgi:hypothetical protein